MEWLIRYDSKKESYFKSWTGIGPMFGAAKKAAHRFPAKELAIAAIRAMPDVAAIMCEIERDDDD